MTKNKGVDHMQCTVCTLSQIFTVMIRNWNYFANFCN